MFTNWIDRHINSQNPTDLPPQPSKAPTMTPNVKKTSSLSVNELKEQKAAAAEAAAAKLIEEEQMEEAIKMAAEKKRKEQGAAAVLKKKLDLERKAAAEAAEQQKKAAEKRKKAEDANKAKAEPPALRKKTEDDNTKAKIEVAEEQKASEVIAAAAAQETQEQSPKNTLVPQDNVESGAATDEKREEEAQKTREVVIAVDAAVEMGSIVSGNGASEDELVSRRELKAWLFRHGGISGSLANKYIDILWEEGVGTVARLERKLSRDHNYLLSIGFDQYDVEDIMNAHPAATDTNVEKETIRQLTLHIQELQTQLAQSSRLLPPPMTIPITNSSSFLDPAAMTTFPPSIHLPFDLKMSSPSSQPQWQPQPQPQQQQQQQQPMKTYSSWIPPPGFPPPPPGLLNSCPPLPSPGLLNSCPPGVNSASPFLQQQHLTRPPGATFSGGGGGSGGEGGNATTKTGKPDIEGFCCPVSLEIMQDPVVAADGITYEHKTIQDWFDICVREDRPATSPITGAILPYTFLIPNNAVKNLIDNYKKRNQG